MNWTSLKLTASIAISLFSIGCATTSNIAFPNDTSLASARTIQPGKTTMTDVRAKFGRPFKIESKDNEILWTYDANGSKSQRLTVAFDSSSAVTNSVIWVPRANTEAKLTDIKKHFPKADFSIIEAEQGPPCYISDEISYVDRVNGIAIMSSKKNEYADGVGWSLTDEQSR